MLFRKQFLKCFLPILLTVVFSVNAFASDGPGGTGGGDLIPKARLRAEDVVNEVPKLKRKVQMVLNRLELEKGLQLPFQSGAEAGVSITCSDRNLTLAQYARTLELLFGRKGEKSRAHEALATLEFHGQTKAECRDRTGEPKDATAFDENNPSRICIGAERIASKVSSSDLEREMIALATHEVSHHLGANEEEAQNVQACTLQHLNSTTIERAEKWSEALSSVLLRINSRLNQVLDDSLRTGNFREICSQMAAIQDGSIQLDELNDQLSELGASPLRKRHVDELTGIVARLHLLGYACIQEGDTEKKEMKNKWFNGCGLIPMEELVSHFAQPMYDLAASLLTTTTASRIAVTYDGDLGRVRYPQYRNWNTLKAEIQDIQKMMSSISKALEEGRPRALAIIPLRSN